VAPSGAPFGVLSRCMRLSGKAATVLGTCVPGLTGRGSDFGVIRDDASAWPVAREVPAGWCTIPTGDPRPGDDRLAICGLASIPAVLFAPLSGCSRQHWRLVCVPLRHVLPIGVSRFRGIRPPNPRSSPTSGGRPLQRAGVLHLRQCLTPAPAPPRLTSHRQVYPRAGRGLG
jgi:hypothetical protein